MIEISARSGENIFFVKFMNADRLLNSDWLKRSENVKQYLKIII